MAATFRVEMEGLPELKRRVDGLSLDLRRRAIRVALRAAARPVVEEAKRLAPVDTGKLRKNIITRVTVTGTKTEAAIGPSREAYYGMFVELGTRLQPAQPFLRPALDNRKEQAVQAFRDALRRIINKYAERAGVA